MPHHPHDPGQQRPHDGAPHPKPDPKVEACINAGVQQLFAGYNDAQRTAYADGPGMQYAPFDGETIDAYWNGPGSQAKRTAYTDADRAKISADFNALADSCKANP